MAEPLFSKYNLSLALLEQENRIKAAVEKIEPNTFLHLLLRRGRAIAKVALARKLAVRLFWMWRKGQDYQQVKKFGSDTGQLEVPNCAKRLIVAKSNDKPSGMN